MSRRLLSRGIYAYDSEYVVQREGGGGRVWQCNFVSTRGCFDDLFRDSSFARRGVFVCEAEEASMRLKKTFVELPLWRRKIM
jgi:hypothetical protein